MPEAPPEHGDGSGGPLADPRFPRASEYDWRWLTEGSFGANPLWLGEWLCESLPLRQGMNVLDLGCGRAKSSIFLAREFGVNVVAFDLWVEAGENRRRIASDGLSDVITPVQGDAGQLDFPEGAFDAIVSIDAYQYFGTERGFLGEILRVLRPGGVLGIASCCLMSEFDGGRVPEHLEQFWNDDCWCVRTASWWRAHWSNDPLVADGRAELVTHEVMPRGIDWWVRWAIACGTSDWYTRALKADDGRYLGYFKQVLTKIG
jgi:ubiquinone/menaquinone biosynthesis C-methylase UbiE